MEMFITDSSTVLYYFPLKIPFIIHHSGITDWNETKNGTSHMYSTEQIRALL